MTLGTAAAFGLFALAQAQQEFYQDFRGAAQMQADLSLFGPTSAGATQQEAEGFRITLAADRESRAAVGVAPHFHISGDFEITVGYQILSVDRPTAGMGAGIKVWGEIRSDDSQSMTLGHLLPPQGKERFVAMLSRDAPGGKRRFDNATRYTTATSGRMRLARVGSELRFLVAEGDADTFAEIHRAAVGTGDVLALRVSANTSDAPCGVTIRLIDLRVRGARLALSSGTGGAGAPRTTPRARGGLAGWALILAAVVVGGLLLVRQVATSRRKSRP